MATQANGSTAVVPCDRTCLFKGVMNSCSDRVQWLVDVDRSSDMASDVVGAAVGVVNGDCLGQCACTISDFSWLEASLEASGGEMSSINEHLPCQTARADQQCFKAVEWAMTHGLYWHPERYENLTSGSTFEQFQDVLSRNGVEHCRRPCDMCHTASPGEECHDEVLAALDQFLMKASFEEVQAALNKSGSTCPMPCRRCRTAVPGDACYTGITWAMRHGIRISPEKYPNLTPESSLDDFQTFLHSMNLKRCAMPCLPGSDWQPAEAPALIMAAVGEFIHLGLPRSDAGEMSLMPL